MKDTYIIQYSPAAIDDLKSIYTYIAEELSVPDTAEKQVNRIRAAARSLNVFPRRHEHVQWEPWCESDIYKMPVDNYLIFYQVQESTVTVIRIFYEGQDIETILKEPGS